MEIVVTYRDMSTVHGYLITDNKNIKPFGYTYDRNKVDVVFPELFSYTAFNLIWQIDNGNYRIASTHKELREFIGSIKETGINTSMNFGIFQIDIEKSSLDSVYVKEILADSATLLEWNGFTYFEKTIN